MTIDPFENKFELDKGIADNGGEDDDNITSIGTLD